MKTTTFTRRFDDVTNQMIFTIDRTTTDGDVERGVYTFDSPEDLEEFKKALTRMVKNSQKLHGL